MAAPTSDFAGHRLDEEWVAVEPQSDSAMLWALAHFIDNGEDMEKYRFLIPSDSFPEALYNIRAAGFTIVMQEV